MYLCTFSNNIFVRVLYEIETVKCVNKFKMFNIIWQICQKIDTLIINIIGFTVHSLYGTKNGENPMIIMMWFLHCAVNKLVIIIYRKIKLLRKLII